MIGVTLEVANTEEARRHRDTCVNLSKQLTPLTGPRTSRCVGSVALSLCSSTSIGFQAEPPRRETPGNIRHAPCTCETLFQDTNRRYCRGTRRRARAAFAQATLRVEDSGIS